MAEQTFAKFDDKQLRSFLNRTSKKFNQITTGQRSYLKLIAIKVFQDIIDHFDREEGPEGRWREIAPWHPKYKRWKEPAAKYLQDSGNLRMGILPIEHGKQAYGKADGSAIVFFNPARTKKGFPYAAAHDEGIMGQPKRTFMWLSDKGMKGVVEETEKFFTSGSK